jgi:hypothetical protein
MTGGEAICGIRMEHSRSRKPLFGQRNPGEQLGFHGTEFGVGVVGQG